MPQRIIRFALDMWDFVIVELNVEGNWDATNVKYRGTKLGKTATRDELKAGVSYGLPDGGSLHIVLPATLLPTPQVSLNNTRLCQVLFDPVDRVRNARNAVRLLGAMQICTSFWSIIQSRGDLSLIESVVPLLYGMIYLLLSTGIARRSQLVTLATPLLIFAEIIAIVMTPLGGKSIALKTGSIVLRILVFSFIARAVRAIHRIKKAEADQSELPATLD
jgi:hypothetical protein